MNLGAAKYTLGMEIRRDRANKKLWLSQSKFVNSVLQHFRITNYKPLTVLIAMGTKLAVKQCPTTLAETNDMASVLYASAVGILMYDMVCIRAYIAQAVRVLNQFMDNPGCKHWVAVKRVSRYL
jgi:hypothetical protein